MSTRYFTSISSSSSVRTVAGPGSYNHAAVNMPPKCLASSLKPLLLCKTLFIAACIFSSHHNMHFAAIVVVCKRALEEGINMHRVASQISPFTYRPAESREMAAKSCLRVRGCKKLYVSPRGLLLLLDSAANRACRSDNFSNTIPSDTQRMRAPLIDGLGHKAWSVTVPVYRSRTPSF